MASIIHPEGPSVYQKDNCMKCTLGCFVECCAPTILSCCCVCINSPIAIKSKERAERWSIRNRASTACCDGCFYYWDMCYDCNCSSLYVFFENRWKVFRDTQDFFCAFNKVNIWEKEQCESLLLTPQGRGNYLGNTDLVDKNLPSGIDGIKINSNLIALRIYIVSNLIRSPAFHAMCIWG